MNEEVKSTEVQEGRIPKLWEALLTMAVMVVVIAVGIIVFEVDPHVPMFIGVIASALMALHLGYKWETIEKGMMDGIYKALQSIIILIIVGILIGVWIDAGVVPTMIYFGLKILNPGIFFVATVLICSITSIATGTSWGTMGTMGVALMGIGFGLGMNPAITAGAVISGAYFGDKMSPMSDTTNLAPAMAGTDIITHIKAMILPTVFAYVITLIIFAVLGFFQYKGGDADMSRVLEFSNALNATEGGVFVIHPILLLPPIIVIVAVALKVPAVPGIVMGILSGAILGLILQPNCSLGSLFQFGLDGFSFSDEIIAMLTKSVSEETLYTMKRLLNTGGIMGMMFSVSMTIIAMMFGGIMETTHQLEVIVNELKKLIKTPAGLVTLTTATCVASNITMPEQYISVVVPGRMYADEYKKMGLHPSLLSATLQGAGTVTSALVPWNTCGAFIRNTLGISAASYGPFAFFNWIMPLATILFAYLGITIKDLNNKRFANTRPADR